MTAIITDVADRILAAAIARARDPEDALAPAQVLPHADAPTVALALVARGFPALAPPAIAATSSAHAHLERLFRSCSRSQLRQTAPATAAVFALNGDPEAIDMLLRVLSHSDTNDQYLIDLIVREAIPAAAAVGDLAMMDKLFGLAPHASISGAAARRAGAAGQLPALEWLRVKAQSLLPAHAPVATVNMHLGRLFRSTPADATKLGRTDMLAWWVPYRDRRHDGEQLFVQSAFVATTEWWKEQELVWLRTTQYTLQAGLVKALNRGDRELAQWWWDRSGEWIVAKVAAHKQAKFSLWQGAELVKAAASYAASPASLEWLWHVTHPPSAPDTTTSSTTKDPDMRFFSWATASPTLISQATACGATASLEWWRRQCQTHRGLHFNPDSKDLQLALGAGHLETLQWWQAALAPAEFAWGDDGRLGRALTAATKDSQIGCLYFWLVTAVADQVPFRKSLINIIVKARSIATLEWWWAREPEHGLVPFPTDLAVFARIENGLELLQWWWTKALICDPSAGQRCWWTAETWMAVVVDASSNQYLRLLEWWYAAVFSPPQMDLNAPLFPRLEFLSALSLEHLITEACTNAPTPILDFWYEFAIENGLEFPITPKTTQITHESQSLMGLDWWWQKYVDHVHGRGDGGSRYFVLQRRSNLAERYWLLEKHLRFGLPIVFHPFALPQSDTNGRQGWWWNVQQLHGLKLWVLTGEDRNLMVPTPFWLERDPETEGFRYHIQGG
ncbi:hypothetical protein BC828DRAFT_389351 [Blastocladiella britannica]|nr:hypothetical protein BC828DRAFT_389351 [Blastocladiella britannica]